VAPGTGPAVAGFARRWDGLARVQGAFGGAVLDLRVLGVQENQQYASGASSVNYNDNWQLDMIAGATLGGDGGTEIRAHLSGYDHKFASGPLGSPAGPDWDRQRIFDVEALHRGSAGSARWLSGLKAEREWIIADRVAAGDERGGWTGAAYGSLEFPLGTALLVSAGARLTASEEWGLNAAPRAAVTLRSPAGFYLKAAGARGFRAPSFKDLYQDYLNARARYRVRGNPDLDPESSWNVNGEAGFANAYTRLYLRGYSNWLRDFIESVQTGTDAGILLLDYRNIGRARTYGVEAGGAAAAGFTEVSGSYGFLEARDADTDLSLTGRSRHTARAAVTVSPDPVSVRGEVVYSGRVLVSRSAAGAESFQEGYTRLNASLIARLPLGLRAALGVENLANTIPAGAIAPLGRRWHVSGSWGVPW
jgi:outer membrane receptor for ferrienterochelin and colicins